MLKRRSPRSPTHRRLLSWWIVWRVPTLLLIVMAVWWFLYRPLIEDRDWVRVEGEFTLCSERFAGAVGCVIDGDTIVMGTGAQRERIRLTGFDAPELDGACSDERALAFRARMRTLRWLNSGSFEWDGGLNAPRDQYGRELREARRASSEGEIEWLSDVMIGTGLAGDGGPYAREVDWCA